MARKPRQERSRSTVNAIIKAGFIAVGQNGIGATTTREIAEIAGIGIGSLYEYFDNKEAIFQAMQEQFVREIIGIIEPLTPELTRLPIAEAVRQILTAFAEFLKRDDGIYLAVARHALQTDITGHLQQVSRALMDLTALYVMQNPDYARVRDIPAMSYVFINGGIFTVLRHLSDPNPPITFAQLTEALANMVGHYAKYESVRNNQQRQVVNSVNWP